MTRMLAPEGVSSFSHAGHAFDVAEDGTIDVAEHAVEVAQAHGFRVIGEGEAPVSETVTVRRESVLKVLEAMGVAANPAMRADKLSAAFDGAAARVVKPKPAEPKGGDGNKTPAGDNKSGDGKGSDKAGDDKNKAADGGQGSGK